MRFARARPSAVTCRVNKRIARSMCRSESIQHHTRDYGDNFSFWVIAEILDCSDLSRKFEGLPVVDQITIVESFDIRPHMEGEGLRLSIERS